MIGDRPSTTLGAASAKHRERLKTYCTLLPVTGSVPIGHYFAHAKRLHTQGVEFYRRVHDLDRAYIDLWSSLQMLLEVIPKHPQFSSIQDLKFKTNRTNVETKILQFVQWADETRASSMILLEKIVQQMDSAILTAQESALTNALIDEFEEFDLQPPPSSSVSMTNPSVDNSTNELIPLSTQVEEELITEFTIAPNVPHYDDLCISNVPSSTEEKQEFTTLLYPTIDDITPATSMVPHNSQISGIDMAISYLRTVDSSVISILRDIFYLNPTSVPSSNTKPCLLPTVAGVQVGLSSSCTMFCTRIDYHVSFTPLFTSLSPLLQMSDAALETNRCFFLHLGVALDIHPYLLQIALRILVHTRLYPSSSKSATILSNETGNDDCWYNEILKTIEQPSHFVDANCLSFLWFTELIGTHVLLLSGPLSSPIVSSFRLKSDSEQTKSKHEILLYCDGQHFVQLKPQSIEMSHERILEEARRGGRIVNENEILPTLPLTIRDLFHAVQSFH